MNIKLKPLLLKPYINLNEQDHIEPEQPPFPAEFHELLKSLKHKFPGPDAHKVMRETLKKIGTEQGIDAAVDYVISQFPEYEDKKDLLKQVLSIDHIDKKVQFIG